MAKTKHNSTLRRSAAAYKRLGFKVKADLPEYEKPKSINKKRPDLIAKKGKREIIVEVETPSSYKKDAPQRKVFKKYASKSPNRKFRTKKIK